MAGKLSHGSECEWNFFIVQKIYLRSDIWNLSGPTRVLHTELKSTQKKCDFLMNSHRNFRSMECNFIFYLFFLSPSVFCVIFILYLFLIDSFASSCAAGEETRVYAASTDQARCRERLPFVGFVWKLIYREISCCCTRCKTSSCTGFGTILSRTTATMRRKVSQSKQTENIQWINDEDDDDERS